MQALDINSDMGESFGVYKLGDDKKLLDMITSANIACGWHAGDPCVMHSTVLMSVQKGVAVGAHPGFLDLIGFGRRNMQISKSEAFNYTLYQVGALAAFAKAAGTSLQHVKPHGAMYNLASTDFELASAICEAVKAISGDIIILAPSNSMFKPAAYNVGLRFAGEFFADRAYNPDGSLVPRSVPGSVIEDIKLACERVLQLAKTKTVTCADGSAIDIDAVSVCVHGDNSHAIEMASAIKSVLKMSCIEIKPLGELVS